MARVYAQALEFYCVNEILPFQPTYQCSLLPYTSASADVFVYTEGYYYYNFFNFVINGRRVNPDIGVVINFSFRNPC